MSLQAWFPLSCDLLDYGPHKLQLETRTNATMSAETFNTGGSVYFNNGYLRYTLTQAFKDSFSENKMSLSCWIKTTYTGYKQLCKIGTNSTGWADLKFGIDVTTQPYLCVTDSNNASKTITNGPTVTNGSWHHLVGIYDAGDMKLYIDNVLVKTDTTTTIPNVTNANAYIYLGGSGSGERMSPGNLKDARFYNHALTTDEVASLYRAGIPKKGLQVWLPLDGNVNNYGLAKCTITNIGASVNNSGQIGKCYQFATNQYLKSNSNPLNSNTPNFTIAAWTYCTGDYIILYSSRTNGSESGIYVAIQPGNSIILFDDNSSRWQLTQSLPQNQWTHVCFVRTSSQKKVYINGQLLNSTNTIGTLTNIHTSFFISNNANGDTVGTLWSTGKINDYRIYDRALTDSEIKRLAQGRVLHYLMNSPYIENTNNVLIGKTDFTNDNVWRRNKVNMNDPPELLSNGNIKLIGGGTGTQNYIENRYSGFIPVQPNTTYTLSVRAKINTSARLLLYFYEYDSSETLVTRTIVTLLPDSKGFQRYKNTFTTASTTIQGYIEINNNAGSVGSTVILENNSILLEAKSYATEFDYGTRTATKIYDGNGFNKYGTIGGSLFIKNDTPRYKYSITSNGVGANVISLAQQGNKPLTCTFWIKPLRVNTNEIIFVDRTSYFAFGLYKSNDILLVSYNSDKRTAYEITNYLANQWIFVTLTRESDNDIKLYFNGELQPVSSKQDHWSTTVQNLNIFSRNGSNPFNGYISDFRMYATHLSTDDIIELYHMGHVPTT